MRRAGLLGDGEMRGWSSGRRAQALLTIILLLLLMVVRGGSEGGGDNIYHNQFAVHIPDGDHVADQVAARSGFTNLGQIGALERHYLFEDQRIYKRSTEIHLGHHKNLENAPEVEWTMQQKEIKRVKRDIQTGAGKTMDFTKIKDPLYRSQWFLNHGARDGSDMNVLGAWKMGYTGKGVVITILDDGIQYNHPDLKQNYDPLASKDINNNDDDPMPQDNGDNKHGTRCAGEVAAVAFNDYCGVGIAFNASIGGVRMLDGLVNDAVEAHSLSLNPSHIDVYSASWGPEDDGKTVDGPGPLAKKAFIEGVQKGRGGLGSIFVWASGNGGHHTDNCNCDGYTNSIYTLSISSATQGGFKPWYLEECSSTLATTYSSGSPGQDASIATVDQDARLRPDKICTTAHTGTSASAPIAAGVVALALEANRNLTWRDLQHMVVVTSNPAPLQHEPGWQKNYVKRSYSHKFGYGLLDATKMVKMALKWKTTPKQHICETRVESTNKILSKATNMRANVSLITDGCDNMLSKVQFLEHVQARISVKYFPRGQLKIVLVSPRGTRSTLLFPRPKDKLASNFEDWPFLSVHFWGEDPTGEWTLEINNAGPAMAKSDGLLKHWQLVLYGTETNPLGLLDVKLDSKKIKPTTISSNDVISEKLKEEETTTVVDLSVQGCHEECSRGCSGPGSDKCNDCKNFVHQGKCVKICPLGTYTSLQRDGKKEFKQKQCQNCHSTCEKCWGPGNSNCLSCSGDNVLLSKSGLCESSCPSGYFEDDQKVCHECEGNCKTCNVESNSTLCLTCPQEYVLHQSSCIPNCPVDHFPATVIVNEGDKCQACHESCETCVGALDTQCGRCKKDTFYFERRCVAYCPSGYTSDLARQECVACPSGCDDCPGGGGVCKECRDGWRLLPSGLCLPPQSLQCQPGMYAGRGTCLACHTSCSTCLGPKDRDCTSCYPDHRLHVSSCVETCPVGSKPSPEVNTCLSCPHTCLSCSDSGCSACRSGYHLLPDLGTCVTHCREGEFSNSDGVCTKCHFSCLDCYGPGSNQCSSCHGSSRPLLSDGQCLETCPNGSHKDSESSCNHCHSSCSACSGAGPGNCTVCSSSEILRSGFCVSCEDGFYVSTETGHCHPCHSSCQRCTGPDPNQCISCVGQLQLDSWSSICVPCCLDTEVSTSIPCCPCGPGRGLCTSPTRAPRSPSLLGLGLNSTGSLLLGLAVMLVVVVSLLYVSLSFRHKAPGVYGNGQALYRTLPSKEKKTLLEKTEAESSADESSDEESQFLFINRQ